jgi:hypothetical protein
LNEYYVFCQVLSLVVSGLIVAANVPMLSQWLDLKVLLIF